MGIFMSSLEPESLESPSASVNDIYLANNNTHAIRLKSLENSRRSHRRKLSRMKEEFDKLSKAHTVTQQHILLLRVENQILREQLSRLAQNGEPGAPEAEYERELIGEQG